MKKQPCESFRRKACGHYDEDKGCLIKVTPPPDGWERVAEHDWCVQYGLMPVRERY